MHMSNVVHVFSLNPPEQKVVANIRSTLKAISTTTLTLLQVAKVVGRVIFDSCQSELLMCVAQNSSDAQVPVYSLANLPFWYLDWKVN